MRLVHVGLSIAIGLLLAISAAAWESNRRTVPAKTDVASQGPYQQRIAETAKRFEQGNFRGANGELKALLADRRFASLADSQRHGLLLMAGFAAMQSDEAGRARDLFLRSTRIQPSAHAWYMLSLLELGEGSGDQAAIYLTRAVQEDPQALDEFHPILVPEAIRESKRGSDARMGLLQALYDANWNQRGLGASNLWFDLVEQRVQRNESAQADGALERIDGAMTLLKLRADRRFDGMMRISEDRPSPELAARKRVERLQNLAREKPRRLEPITELMAALLVLGEWNEVLRLSDEIDHRLKGAPADAPPFDDMDEHLWVQDRRSVALRALGRTDEAVAELAEAARRSDHGQPNVNQVLNLGSLYCELGRPDDALAAIAPVGEMNGYGKLVQASVQLRAAVLKKDGRAVNRALEYLRAHRDDGEGVLLEGLVSSGRLDEAATELIAQLEAVDTRAETLLSLQDLRERDPLPGEVETRANWKALVARADVQAVVNRVGRIESHAIYLGWGNQ